MTEPTFKKYTDLIDEKTDLVGMMADQGQEVCTWLGTISESDSLIVHAPYTWTLKEVVNHLSDCERVFAYRALWVARGGDMPLIPFDEDEFSRRAKANQFTISSLTTEFQAVRSSSLALFQNLPEDAWGAVGQVMGHEVTVRKLATILVGHVTHHWNIVMKRFGLDV
jgi:DinB superfamily